MEKLKEISIEEAEKIIPDKEALKRVSEPILKLNKEKTQPIDPLLKVEISLRKCERTGVFD